jgi:DNA polymerase
MTDPTDAVLPPEAPKKKRSRPKIEAVPTPLYNFPGTTKQEKLDQLQTLWGACKRCFLGELRDQVGGGLIFGEGNPDAHVLIIGEAPGDEEEKHGSPFIGPAGKMLNQILAVTSDDPEIQYLADWYAKQPRAGKKGDEAGEEFHDRVWQWRTREFYITNVVSCRPPENRPPTPPETKACWERLWNIIYIVDPLLIIACGNAAMTALTQKSSVQITKTRGQLFDVTMPGKLRDLTYPVMPVHHPSFLLRTADWRLKDGNYAKTVADWRKAMMLVDFLRQQHFGTPIPTR